MTRDILTRQGRAKGLYDEQLQREQQERKLFRQADHTEASENRKEAARADG